MRRMKWDASVKSSIKFAFGFAMKVTHFINDTAAVGGSLVRSDGWQCISGSSAVVRADRLWGQATISCTS